MFSDLFCQTDSSVFHRHIYLCDLSDMIQNIKACCLKCFCLIQNLCCLHSCILLPANIFLSDSESPDFFHFYMFDILRQHLLHKMSFFCTSCKNTEYLFYFVSFSFIFVFSTILSFKPIVFNSPVLNAGFHVSNTP